MIILAIAVGLLVNVLFVEFIGITAGGMVVPGYIALQLNHPWGVASAAGLSFATYGIVKGLSHFFLIYGRRFFVFCVLIGFLMTQGYFYLFKQSWFVQTDEGMRTIGMIIPGLIAYWMERQGVLEAICGMIVGSVLTYFIFVFVLGVTFQL